MQLNKFSSDILKVRRYRYFEDITSTLHLPPDLLKYAALTSHTRREVRTERLPLNPCTQPY